MRGKQARFTEEEKIDLKVQVDQLLEAGMSGKDIAKKLGISPSYVTQLKKMKMSDFKEFN